MACGWDPDSSRGFHRVCLMPRDIGGAPASWEGSLGQFLALGLLCAFCIFSLWVTFLPFISLALALTSANPAKIQWRQDLVYLLLLKYFAD